MKNIWILFLLIGFNYSSLNAQGGFAWGVKGGLTMGLQQWNSFEREPLFRYHGAIYTESIDDANFSLFAELGYHIKGSALRFRSFTNNQGQRIPGRTEGNEFHNLSVILGGKQKKEFGLAGWWYYLVGIRGDYNLRAEIFSGNFDQGINKFTYGVTVGGGIEFPLFEGVGGLLEIQLSPDFSKQIFIPSQTFTDSSSGRTFTFREENVSNTVIEISFGIKFIREYEYVDDY
jgi:hypothetical protein